MKVTVPNASNQPVGMADLIALPVPNDGASFASAMQANELTNAAAGAGQALTVRNQEPATEQAGALGSSAHKEPSRPVRKSQARGGPASHGATSQPAITAKMLIPVLLAPVHQAAVHMNGSDPLGCEEMQSIERTAEVSGNRAPAQMDAQPAQRDVNRFGFTAKAEDYETAQAESLGFARAEESDIGSVAAAELLKLPGVDVQEHVRHVHEFASPDTGTTTAPDPPTRASADLTVVAGAEQPSAPVNAQVSVAGGEVSAAVPAISSSTVPQAVPTAEPKEDGRAVPEIKPDATEQQKRSSAEPQDAQRTSGTSSPSVAIAATGATRDEAGGGQPHRSASGAVLKGDTPRLSPHGGDGASGGSSLSPTFPQTSQPPVGSAHAPHTTPETATVFNHRAEELMQQKLEGNAARALGSAMRAGPLGIQTELFGRVTIQSSSGAGELSAQLFLENAKHGAVLAMHLPALEQRIGERFGVNASVQLGGTDQTSTASSGGGERGSRYSQAKNQEAPFTSRPSVAIAANPAIDGSGLHAGPIAGANSIFRSRLDVTA